MLLLLGLTIGWELTSCGFKDSGNPANNQNDQAKQDLFFKLYFVRPNPKLMIFKVNVMPTTHPEWRSYAMVTIKNNHQEHFTVTSNTRSTEECKELKCFGKIKLHLCSLSPNCSTIEEVSFLPSIMLISNNHSLCTSARNGERESKGHFPFFLFFFELCKVIV